MKIHPYYMHSAGISVMGCQDIPSISAPDDETDGRGFAVTSSSGGCLHRGMRGAQWFVQCCVRTSPGGAALCQKCLSGLIQFLGMSCSAQTVFEQNLELRRKIRWFYMEIWISAFHWEMGRSTDFRPLSPCGHDERVSWEVRPLEEVALVPTTPSRSPTGRPHGQLNLD